MSFEIKETTEALDNNASSFDIDKRIDNVENQSFETNDLDYDVDKRVDNSENIDKCLETFQQDNWDKLSIDEKEMACSNLRDIVCEDLGIENKPRILFDENMNDNTYGTYNYNENIIKLNIQKLDCGKEMMNTIAHETRHAWQYIRANLPENMQTDQDKAFKDNFDNYIQYEDNYFGYLTQVIEADAWLYADAFIDNALNV